jgi:Copper chaperone
MKTSVIEVHDMLSVLSVDEVEKRIGEVPGVESVTVNYAAGSATVRYDETRLEVADIKAIVHQRGHQSAGEKIIPRKSRIVRLLCVLPHSVRAIFRLMCSLEFTILALFDFAFRDRTAGR